MHPKRLCPYMLPTVEANHRVQVGPVSEYINIRGYNIQPNNYIAACIRGSIVVTFSPACHTTRSSHYVYNCPPNQAEGTGGKASVAVPPAVGPGGRNNGRYVTMSDITGVCDILLASTTFQQSDNRGDNVRAMPTEK